LYGNCFAASLCLRALYSASFASISVRLFQMIPKTITASTRHPHSSTRFRSVGIVCIAWTVWTWTFSGSGLLKGEDRKDCMVTVCL
jgi:hypothetical protein